MASSSDNSFIPKRGPAKRKQTGTTRQVYIFTYISYILMFATLLATGGVFLYGQYIDAQLDDEVAALNAEIASFSGEDLARVTEFDLRLQQASQRLNNSVSVASVFDALQAATIETVQIEQLDLSREGDEQFVLTAAILTDSFDSTIFQRGVFGRSNVIGDQVVISEVNTDTQSDTDGDGNVLTNRSVVNFSATLEVPLNNVPYIPAAQTQPSTQAEPITTQPETDETDDAASATSSDSVLETDNETSL